MPARLLDLGVQQTGLGVAILEGDEPGFFAEGTTAALRSVAEASIAGLREKLGDGPRGLAMGQAARRALEASGSSQAGAGEALDIGPAPVDGGSHTVRNTGGELPPHHASSGAEYRIVVDFAAPDRFLAVQNIGNSGVPGSPHYRDQFEPWLRGEYHTVHLTRDGVEADCECRTTIEPA